MKKLTTRQITTVALLLAICIGSQFFKNLSVFITGPIINAALIICVLFVGLVPALALSVITPLTSFIITGSPIMSAVPLIIPFVMIGNAVLVLTIYFMNKMSKKLAKFPLIPMVAGSVAKAVVMGITISLIIVPLMLPEAMSAMLSKVQLTFSLVQFLTALIGSAYALILLIPLRIFMKNNAEVSDKKD